MESLPGYVEFNKTFEPRRPQSLFPNAPDDVIDLLYRMLDYNPQTRISAEEVRKGGGGEVQALRHPFFTNEPAMTPVKDIPYWS